MKLILNIENVASLASGDPLQIQLEEHGLVIGRAAHADWTLPDPRNHISSIHCEIDYRDGAYVLTDRSTNGTYVNGSGQRLSGPHKLADGDLITIGHYEIRALLPDSRTAAAHGSHSPHSAGLDWLSGSTTTSADTSAPADPARFGRPAAQPLFQSAADPMMSAFAAPLPSASPAQPMPPAADPFGLVSSPEPSFAGAPASFPAQPAAPAPQDNPWATLQQFGSIDFADPASRPPSPPSPPPSAAEGTSHAEDDLFERFLSAAGLRRRDIGDVAPADVMAAAGQLLRQTADGLIRLLDARVRVRHQFGVGAQVTAFQRAGNNPLKWTRSPEQALRQMIGEPEAGFLPGPQAVRGAFEDLQAHEMAMIAAMQEALQATIERFAPETIRSRATNSGRLASILPGAREAALWRAYEADFKALANESEAAYLDLFAKNFRKAYERNVQKGDLA